MLFVLGVSLINRIVLMKSFFLHLAISLVVFLHILLVFSFEILGVIAIEADIGVLF